MKEIRTRCMQRDIQPKFSFLLLWMKFMPTTSLQHKNSQVWRDYPIHIRQKSALSKKPFYHIRIFILD